MLKNTILFLLILMVLIGCTQNQKIKILIPEGIPAIALGTLLEKEEYECNVVANTDVITSELIQNNYDVIIAPIIVGAKLFNQEASVYQLAAILTFNNLYIFAREGAPLSDISDLNGETIAAFGYNNTPDILLRYALDSNDVQATIVYETSVHDVISNRMMIDPSIQYFLLTEPVLSMMTINLGIEGTIFCLHEEVFGDENEMPQAGVFVHPRVANKDTVLSKIEASTKAVEEDVEGYVEGLLQLDKDMFPLFSRLGSAVLVASIPRSEIKFVFARDAKNLLENYFTFLNEYNSALLQGLLPNEEFYYE